VAFVVGACYSRQDIHNAIGGELVTYLPQHDGRIMAGCFTPKLDPGAPEEVLVGNAPNVIAKAHLLAQQGGTIPVFLKRAKGAWEYVGRYRVARPPSSDPALLRQKEQQAQRSDLVMILYLESQTQR
jgi:hypothetical protein